jgi:hypothetical protein
VIQINSELEVNMTENITKGEMHGCIVCGKLYQLYVVYDSSGNYIDSQVMSTGGKVYGKDIHKPE